MPGEHWIMVRDDGLRNPMEAHDVGKEGMSDGLGVVGVRQGNEMAVLTDAIDDGEDDHLALHLGKCLDEVDADVSPHSRWNWQWL
jgi:hypothetical protein